MSNETVRKVGRKEGKNKPFLVFFIFSEDEEELTLAF